MRKYRNTKIVKSILLGLPVLFCSCYNNDSIKNGHYEDEKDFRYENGVVKIYNQPGATGILLQEVRVNEELSTKLNAILTYFNDVLKNYPKKAQQFILNNFDTTNGFNTLQDLFVEFCYTHVRYVEKWVKELVLSEEKQCSFVRSYCFYMISEGWKNIKQETSVFMQIP